MLCSKPRFDLILLDQIYRYTKLLAPGIDPLKDERIRSGMRKMASNDPPVADAIDVAAQ